jgi:hypothetical protein
MRDSFQKLEITGLKQDGFDYFIEKYGSQFIEISFFKCPLIADLTKLESLSSIESLSFYWNQRATRLWDLSANTKLKSIALDDFTRLHRLDDLTLSPSLEVVRFGDKIWDSLVLETLSPLTSVRNLRRLSFSAKKILDDRVAPLASIQNLSELEFQSNMFSTEKVAWLTARIGSRVRSRMLAPFFTIENQIPSGNKNIDIFIVGKRKPSLDSVKDKTRIQKYVEKFNSMVEHFREHPEEGEPE